MTHGCASMDIERIFSSFISTVVNFSPALVFHSDPSYTLDSDSVPTFVFGPCPVASFTPGLAFDSDVDPVLDSDFCPAYNSDCATNHSSALNEVQFTRI
ncbi:hypothetical protein EVAR_86761_1 [Eumeta japonica]|uniref:Uncharacterized protein n=1 Tax=Eumeta variegata TaxID=151549 RepID=A0A4C1VZS5_EUMVA|nr:hypothetical protein EVAR_86761_1 [Eumeta japonica]